MKCTQRLYLTASAAALVGHGHPDAVALYASPGDEIPQSAADKFGLVDGHLEGFDPATVPAAAEDQAPVPGPTIDATQDLYLSKDGKSLVAQDDGDAGELYAKVGDQIPQEAHDSFGLVGGHLKDFDPEFDAKAKELATKADADLVNVAEEVNASKEAAPAKDKEQKGGSNKGGIVAPVAPAVAPPTDSAPASTADSAAPAAQTETSAGTAGADAAAQAAEGAGAKA
jgi:hypothetical protein